MSAASDVASIRALAKVLCSRLNTLGHRPATWPVATEVAAEAVVTLRALIDRLPDPVAAERARLDKQLAAACARRGMTVRRTDGAVDLDALPPIPGRAPAPPVTPEDH